MIIIFKQEKKTVSNSFSHQAITKVVEKTMLKKTLRVCKHLYCYKYKLKFILFIISYPSFLPRFMLL